MGSPHLRGLAAAVCAWAFALPCHAQADPVEKAGAASLPSVERFFGSHVVDEALLSPSGRRLSLVMPGPLGRRSLVVMDTDGRLPPRRIVEFSHLDVVNVAWMGDDRLLFSLDDLSLGSGEQREAALGLHVIRADGTSPRVLINRHDSNPQSYRVLDWGHALLKIPDAAFGANPDELVVAQPESWNGGWRGNVPVWLNVVTGGKRTLDMPKPPLKARQWWLDAAGRPRLLLTEEGEFTGGLYWLGDKPDEWTPLWSGNFKDLPFEPLWVDVDGTVYVRHKDREGLLVVSRLDPDTRAPASVPFLRSPGFDLAAEMLGRPGAAGLLGVRVHAMAEETAWFDPAQRAEQELVDQRWPGRVNRVDCRRCGTDEAVTLIITRSDRDPGQLWLHHQRGDRWQPISVVMEGVDPQQMGRISFHRIRTRDDRDLPVWVTHPAFLAPGQAAPAVVMVHGGPWVRGGSWRWKPLNQFLASRGYVVISPEFRGSAGYGEAHLRAGDRQWGSTMQDDVADALLWAQQQGLAGPAACVAGGSYGGYAALMGLVRHPALYRCGIAWGAVADLSLYLEGSLWVKDDISGQQRKALLPQWVLDPAREQERLAAESPVVQAARIQAPVMLVHGEQDLRVPLKHAQRMRSALEKAGRPPTWVTYPKEAHQWARQETWTDFATRIDSFLRTHLGPGADAVAPPVAPLK